MYSHCDLGRLVAFPIGANHGCAVLKFNLKQCTEISSKHIQSPLKQPLCRAVFDPEHLPEWLAGLLLTQVVMDIALGK